MKKHLLTIMTALAIATLLIITGCEADPISVSSISLDKTEISLYPGTSEKLTATLSPTDATAGTGIIWSSDKAETASVDREGNVTAVAVGEATITATTENGLKATCKVTVKTVEVTGIKLSAEKLVLEKGGTADLTATITPDNATDKTITWESSAPAVATVENGKVSALSDGTATITAKTANGLEAECTVTVNPVQATSITLDRSTLELFIGSEDTLTVTFDPADTTDKTITWDSSDSKIATVDNGKVTAIAVGETTITAKTVDGKTASCTVTVKPIPAGSIALDRNTLDIQIGSSDTLTVTFSPESTTDKTLTWKSSDSNVATVDNGTVKALKVGTTTITATSANGKEASCIVTVKPIPATSISLNKTSTELIVGASETLTVSFNPAETTDKTISWESSNDKVATVENGKITAISGGEATITAATENGLKATCTVTVKTVDVTGIKLNPKTLVLEKGCTADLTATITPDNASDKTIIWESSVPAVATVENGKITAVANGDTIITAKTSNGFEATATISVYDIIAGAEPLSTIISERELTEATSLKVFGTLTDDDFKALDDLKKLETLDLTATTNTAIPDSAFEFNKSIRTLLLSNNVKSIGKAALSAMDIVEFNMPDSVETLGEEVFGWSKSLETLHLSDNLTAIPDRTFYRCASLKTVNIPESVESIGYQAFGECESLMLKDKTLVIPDGVKTISKEAFAFCGDTFDKVVLGDNVEYIGMYAFQRLYGDPQIKSSIILPASLKELSDSAFPMATEVTFMGTVPPELVVTLSQSDNKPMQHTNTMYNATVNVPAEAKEAYMNSVWFKGTDAYKRDNGSGGFSNAHMDLYNPANLKTF